MFEFALGVMVGSLLVAIMWKMTATSHTIVIRENKDGLYQLESYEEMITKPDNAKARYYNSPEYRAEKAFIEEHKSK